MRNVKEHLHITIILTLFLCCCHPAAAWSNGGYSDDPTDPDYGTHDRIAEHTLDDEKTLRLGAFNIQVFGKSKAAKPEVMDVLGKIIRTYDIVAIQEIRDKSQTALPALVDVVNANSSAPYDYVVSERLGRTTSKEQYAYIYNNQTVELTEVCTKHVSG